MRPRRRPKRTLLLLTVLRLRLFGRRNLKRKKPLGSRGKLPKKLPWPRKTKAQKMMIPKKRALTKTTDVTTKKQSIY